MVLTSTYLTVTSRHTLLKQFPRKSSSVYWIDSDGGSQVNAFEAYCDMDTNGGGWTPVWSYSSTNYSHFKDDSNAISPIPNWPATNKVNVRISTTPLLNETDKLQTLETARQTDPHQEQHKQLAWCVIR